MITLEVLWLVSSLIKNVLAVDFQPKVSNELIKRNAVQLIFREYVFSFM